MGLLDLILAGIAFNFLYMFFVGSIIFVVVLASALSGNVELTVWLHKIQPKIDELKELRASKSFFIRNHNTIVKFLPFSGILPYSKVLYDTVTKGFVQSVELAMEKERVYLESKV